MKCSVNKLLIRTFYFKAASAQAMIQSQLEREKEEAAAQESDR